MIVITCADIILRKCGVSLTGAYDFVRIAGGITLAAALPMTTAAKGHVAIEFFFNRLPRHTRAAVNALMRIVQILLFSFAAFAFVRYGNRLLLSHEVLPTSRIPYFWLAWLLALSCAITSLVTVYHLFNNGKALFK